MGVLNMEMASSMLIKSLRDESAHSEPLKLSVVAGVLFDALVLIHLFCHMVLMVGAAT